MLFGASRWRSKRPGSDHPKGPPNNEGTVEVGDVMSRCCDVSFGTVTSPKGSRTIGIGWSNGGEYVLPENGRTGAKGHPQDGPGPLG